MNTRADYSVHRTPHLSLSLSLSHVFNCLNFLHKEHAGGRAVSALELPWDDLCTRMPWDDLCACMPWDDLCTCMPWDDLCTCMPWDDLCTRMPWNDLCIYHRNPRMLRHGGRAVSALGSQDNLHNYTMYVYMRSKALGHNTRADCLL